MLKSTFRNLFYIIKFRASSIIFVLVLLIIGFSFRYLDQSPNILSEHSLEIPLVLNGEKLIQHTGYSFVYSEEHEQAKWIAYVLNNKELDGSFDRSDNFREDPFVSSGSADNLDYTKSGYDRGHLAPAADMKWSEKAMSESFYYSNMSPQVPGFNRGIWKKLEEQVRLWAKQYDTLYIVTGPKLESGLPTIGPNQVSVPKLYYKALIAPNQQKGIAFLIPNEKSEEPLSHYLLSIDSLEQILHRDLFYQLADDQENVIEKQVKFWP